MGVNGGHWGLKEEKELEKKNRKSKKVREIRKITKITEIENLKKRGKRKFKKTKLVLKRQCRAAVSSLPLSSPLQEIGDPCTFSMIFLFCYYCQPFPNFPFFFIPLYNLHSIFRLHSRHS